MLFCNVITRFFSKGIIATIIDACHVPGSSEIFYVLSHSSQQPCKNCYSHFTDVKTE